MKKIIIPIIIVLSLIGCKSAPERGIEHIKAGRLKQAERVVEDYLKKSGESSRAYNFLGVIHTESRDYEAAIESFKKAILLEKDEETLSRLYYNMAVAYSRLDKKEKALKGFLAALDYDSTNGRAYYYTGLLYYETGDVLNCIKHWQLYIESGEAGKNVDAIENLILKLRGVY